MSAFHHHRLPLLYLALPVTFFLLLTGVTQLRAQNTHTVTTLEDENHSPPGSALSLREALREADDGDIITFDASLKGTIALTNGPLVIDNNYTIDGPGNSDIELNGLHEFRIFSIEAANPPIDVTIRDLVLANGHADRGACIYGDQNLTLENCTFTTSVAVLEGGAICDLGGSLSITNCRFQDCTTYESGGAVYSESSAVTIINGMFLGNAAIVNGGALCLDGPGSVDLIGCEFEDNEALGSGGAMYAVDASDIWMLQCSFEANAAEADGGAGYSSGSAVTMRQIHFTGNRSERDGASWYCTGPASGTEPEFRAEACIFGGGTSDAAGGAVYGGSNARMELTRTTLHDNRAADGGAMYVSHELVISLSTLSDNIAGMSGGAITLAGTASADLDYCTVASNSASVGDAVYIGTNATFKPLGSILSGNDAGTDIDGQGTLSSRGHNLVGEYPAALSGTDIVGSAADPIDPLLQPLSANGDSTLTRALQACSPAIDAGGSASGYSYDQRGGARNIDGDSDGNAAADIGAYETESGLDDSSPEIYVWSDTLEVSLDANGERQLSEDDLVYMITDNCTVESVTISTSNLNCSHVPSVEVTITAVDNSQNQSSETVTVKVVDLLYPVLTLPPDATLASTACTVDSGSVDIGVATVEDNCGNWTLVRVGPAEYSVGTQYVYWTATDASGNEVTAVQAVTLPDDTPPTLSSMSMITCVLPAGECSISRDLVSLTVPTASDNCSAEVTLSNDAPLEFPVGETDVTWTARDESGNSATTVQRVRVNDDIIPEIVAPPEVEVNVSAGECSRLLNTIYLGVPLVTDNCPGYSVQKSVSNDPLLLGANTVTWTVQDASGNTASATQTVTLVDNEPPFIEAPPDKIFQADAGKCYWTVDPSALGLPTTSDNCPAGIGSASHNAGSTLEIGLHSVVWQVSDAEGHTAYDVQHIRIEGELEFVPHADISTTTDIGMPGAFVYYSDPVGVTDCPGVEIMRTGGLGSGSFFPVGTTTETFRMFDVNGNEETCSFTVTVVDNEAPVILVRLAPQYLWPVNNKLQTINATVEVWDNVPGASTELTSITCNQNANGDITDASLGVFDVQFQLRASRKSNSIREYTVTYTATDLASNTTVGSAIVTVPQQKPKDFDDEELPVPASIALDQNYPNPFNPSTTLSFGLPREGHASLHVYDARGKLVRVLADTHLDAGRYFVTFDGRSATGRVLPSGMYIAVLRVGDQQRERKMLLVR